MVDILPFPTLRVNETDSSEFFTLERCIAIHQQSLAYAIPLVHAKESPEELCTRAINLDASRSSQSLAYYHFSAASGYPDAMRIYGAVLILLEYLPYVDKEEVYGFSRMLYLHGTHWLHAAHLFNDYEALLNLTDVCFSGRLGMLDAPLALYYTEIAMLRRKEVADPAALHERLSWVSHQIDQYLFNMDTGAFPAMVCVCCFKTCFPAGTAARGEDESGDETGSNCRASNPSEKATAGAEASTSANLDPSLPIQCVCGGLVCSSKCAQEHQHPPENAETLNERAARICGRPFPLPLASLWVPTPNLMPSRAQNMVLAPSGAAAPILYSRQPNEQFINALAAPDAHSDLAPRPAARVALNETAEYRLRSFLTNGYRAFVDATAKDFFRDVFNLATTMADGVK